MTRTPRPLQLAGTCPACGTRREIPAPPGGDGYPRLTCTQRCGNDGCTAKIRFRRQPRAQAPGQLAAVAAEPG